MGGSSWVQLGTKGKAKNQILDKEGGGPQMDGGEDRSYLSEGQGAGDLSVLPGLRQKKCGKCNQGSKNAPSIIIEKHPSHQRRTVGE